VWTQSWCKLSELWQCQESCWDLCTARHRRCNSNSKNKYGSFYNIHRFCDIVMWKFCTCKIKALCSDDCGCASDAANLSLMMTLMMLGAVTLGVIEVTFHEDSDGFISLVGRPLTRPRTNSLSSSKILEDTSTCVMSSTCVGNSAGTSSELSGKETPTDEHADGHVCHEVAAGHGCRLWHIVYCMVLPHHTSVSYSSCRWPAQPSPTPFFFDASAACSTNCNWNAFVTSVN